MLTIFKREIAVVFLTLGIFMIVADNLLPAVPFFRMIGIFGMLMTAAAVFIYLTISVRESRLPAETVRKH